jgi:putative transposase
VIERLPKLLHASVRWSLRQAWGLDDPQNAEQHLCNLARRLEQDAPNVAASILEGLNEILTVNRLGPPLKLRRSLACTNCIENMMGTVRRVCRNVKRWRNTAMTLRSTAAGMMESRQGFPSPESLQAPPALRATLVAHHIKHVVTHRVVQRADAA